VKKILAVIIGLLLGGSAAFAFAENPPGSQNPNAAANSQSNASQGQEQGQSQGQGQSQAASGKAKSTSSASITTTESPNFLSLPGVMGAPAILAIPPENHGNIMAPIALPKRMTYEQAQACRKAWLDDEYEGGRSENETRVVAIDYAKPHEAASLDMDLYLGTVSVTASAGYTFLPALCEAAFRALEEGATSILVNYTVEKANVTKGVGFGSSAGGSAIPSTSSPSALSGVAGFGTGYSVVTNEPRLLSLIAVATHDHNAHSHAPLISVSDVSDADAFERVTVKLTPEGFAIR